MKRRVFALILAAALVLGLCMPAAAASEPPQADAFGSTIAAGKTFSAAIAEDGVLWTWGNNYYGTLGAEALSATAGYFSENYPPTFVMDGVYAIAAGSYHMAAIRRDGSLWTWGSNAAGQLGDGSETEMQATPVRVLEHVATVSCGGDFTAAITEDGALWTAGENGSGQLGRGGAAPARSFAQVSLSEPVRSISCGQSHMAAVTEDGALYLWGDNSSGQIGYGAGAQANSPRKVMKGVASASCGWDHTAAVTKDGTLWLWGGNRFFQVGGSPSADELIWEPYELLHGVASVCCGQFLTLAVMEDGSLNAWGWNEYGQVGNGREVTLPEFQAMSFPVRVLEDVSAVACGETHVLAVDTDGALYGWGANSFGQLGDAELGDYFVETMISGEWVQSVPAWLFEGIARPGGSAPEPAPIEPQEDYWVFGRDNYRFINTYSAFGAGPYYIEDADFRAYTALLNEDELALSGWWYGIGDSVQERTASFLRKNLVNWDGSCYGMSLTAALFREGLWADSAYGVDTTYGIPAIFADSNGSLESFINLYHISQATQAGHPSNLGGTCGSDNFYWVMDRMYEKAAAIGAPGSAETPFLVSMWSTFRKGGHTIICYGAEDGVWFFNGEICSRRLCIADPNLTAPSYIYLSDNTPAAFYEQDLAYDIFKFNPNELSTLSVFGREASLDILPMFSTHNHVPTMLSTDGSSVVVQDGQVLYTEGELTVTRIAPTDASDDPDGSEAVFLLDGAYGDFTILPTEEGQPIDVSLYLPGFAAGIRGSLDAARVDGDGTELTLSGAEGPLCVDLFPDDAGLELLTVSASEAAGDVSLRRDAGGVEITGALSDYVIEHMDRQASVTSYEVAEGAGARVSAGSGAVAVYVDSDGDGSYSTRLEGRSGFSDVAPEAYEYQAVLWAVAQGITNGTSDYTFSPDMICTRGQVLTFLWRAMGSPAASSAANPFEDVSEEDYFYDAVRWGVENGITAGTDASHFSPALTCSFAHILTFLWRTMGEPEQTDSELWYGSALAWAEHNGLLRDTAAAGGEVSEACPRKDVVTFLYRILA